MSDYDYGDDEHEDQVDSDDDLAFVPSKRRFQYTTFGNEDDDEQHDSHQHDGKEEATYGSFLNDDGPRKRSRINTGSGTTPMFVKGATVENVETNEAEVGGKEGETDSAAASSTKTKEDEEATREVRARKEQQEAANARFQALLGRGRGDDKSKRSMFRDEEKASAPSFDAPAGLGFASASSNVPENEEANSTPHFGGLGMPSQFGGLGSGNRTEPDAAAPVRVDPNLGKWEKHTKGIGMKLLSKMGYKGSGGLGAKRVRKKESDNDTKPAAARTGISRPVEVVVRPSNLGLGYGSFKEATQLKVNQQIEAEVRGVELPKKKESKQESGAETSGVSSSALPSTHELLQQQSWKKGSRQASRKRQKRTIVPYKELLETQKQPVVIDMRGPAANQGADASESKEVPLAEELLHNVTVLLNTYENKLHSTSHFVQSTKRKLTSLQSDVDDMERRKREMEERTVKLKNVLSIMDSIDDLVDNGDGDDSAKKVQSLVQQLREGFSEEERVALKFDQVVAPSLLGPMIQSRLEQWDPLGDSAASSEELVVSVLNLGASEGMPDNADTKRSVFTNHILPRVKKAFESTKWNPIEDVENGIQLYEAVLRAAKRVSPPKQTNAALQYDDANVLPSDAIDESGELGLVEMLSQEIMFDAIAPKLSRTLSQWTPTLDESGRQVDDRIDLWILPWFPYLDHPVILPQLVSDARRKLRSGLSFLQRNVHDDKTFCNACLQMLKPWANVIKRETLQELTSKYVTPRLARCLSRIAISRTPETQHWTAVDMLFQWNDSGLLSKQEFLSLVEGELLSNWVVKLYDWLASKEGADMAALAEFYRLWKIHVFLLDGDAGAPTNSTIVSLRNDEMICRMLYSGLVLVKVAHDDSMDLEDYRPSPSTYQTVLARRTKEERLRLETDLQRMDMEPSSNGIPNRARTRRKGEPATFRDVVEDFAKEHDVLFRPRMGANSIKDGKPVFLFGDIPVYFDSNVIFALQQSEWKPLSLDQLAGMV